MVGSQEDSAASEYRYLCTSVPSACEYAPPTAPSLKADVCWNGSVARLTPTAGCQTGEWPYYVEAGEVVDPLTNEVQAYVPLNDACGRGYCIVKPPGAGPTQPGALCCGESGCESTLTVNCGENKELVFCGDGESAEQQGEEWWCYEPE